MQVSTLLQQVIDGMNAMLVIDSVTASGSNWIVTTDDTLWLNTKDRFDLIGNTYQIVEYTKDVSITLEAIGGHSTAPIVGSYNIPPPTFIHGKYKAAVSEIKRASGREIIPFVWMIELQTRTKPSELDSIIQHEGQVRLFFCNQTKWEEETDWQYSEVIEPLQSLVDLFIENLKSHPRIGDLGNVDITNHAKVTTGNSSITEEEENQLFDRELTGIEVLVDLPIKINMTGCEDVVVSGCEGVHIYASDGAFIETVPSGDKYTLSGGGGSGFVENSDSSYTNTVASGSTLVLPDINVTDSDGSISSVPSVQDVVCSPAADSTVENSDSSYTNTVASGATLVLPDINVTDSDGSISSVPSVQDVLCTPAADATVENSDSSYTNTVASGGTLVLPDITVTDSDGSTFTQASVVNVVCSLAADGTVNVNSVFFDNVASGGTLNIEVRQSSGNTLIGSKQGSHFRIPDSVITLDNTDGTTLSTTNVLATDASTITAPDATAVIKNTLNAVLRSELVPSNVSEDIIIGDATININKSDGTLIASATVTAEGSGVYNVADSTVNVVNTLGTVLSSNLVKATETDTVLAPDANVENSDSSYTNTVASGGTITLPDITVTDSDGTTFTQPSVVNVVCSLAANPTVYCRPSNCVQSISYANGDAAFSKEDTFEHKQTGKIQQIDHSVATPNHFNTLVDNDPEFGAKVRFTNDSGTSVFGTNPASTLIYDNLQGVIFDVVDFRNDNRRTIADAWTIAQAKSETLNGKTYATWYLAPIEYLIAVVDEDWTTTEPRLYNAFGTGVIAMSSTYFRGGIAGKYYISNSTSTSSGIVVKTPTNFNMIYMAFIEDGI